MENKHKVTHWSIQNAMHDFVSELLRNPFTKSFPETLKKIGYEKKTLIRELMHFMALKRENSISEDGSTGYKVRYVLNKENYNSFVESVCKKKLKEEKSTNMKHTIHITESQMRRLAECKCKEIVECDCGGAMGGGAIGGCAIDGGGGPINGASTDQIVTDGAPIMPFGGVNRRGSIIKKRKKKNER